MPKALNLVGERFGRLVVTELVGAIGAKRYWRCTCDCGTVKDVAGGSLCSGRTSSCGCAAREKTRRMGLANRTHGKSKGAEYTTWLAMRARCYDTKQISYPLYGGRGISVCDAWRDSFEAFYADMGPRPAGKSLDRIDGNKGYSPGNCRWATASEQGRNKSTAAIVRVGDREQCVAAWLEEFGLAEQTYYSRLRSGWPPEFALTSPANRKRPKRRKTQAMALEMTVEA